MSRAVMCHALALPLADSVVDVLTAALTDTPPDDDADTDDMTL